MPEHHGREQFKKLKTGNGVHADLTATTNDRLELTVIELQKLQDNTGEQTKELASLQKDVINLTDTIKAANEKNDKLQTWFLILAVISAVFATSGVIQTLDILARGIGR